MWRVIFLPLFLFTNPAKSDVIYIACSSLSSMIEVDRRMYGKSTFEQNMLEARSGSCWIENRSTVGILDARVILAQGGGELRVGPGFSRIDCRVVSCPLSSNASGYIQGTLNEQRVIAALPVDFVHWVSSTPNLIFRMYDNCSPRVVEQVLRDHAEWSLRPEGDYHDTQQFLADRGYYGRPIDGLFGPDSEQALSMWVNLSCPW